MSVLSRRRPPAAAAVMAAAGFAVAALALAGCSEGGETAPEPTGSPSLSSSKVTSTTSTSVPPTEESTAIAPAASPVSPATPAMSTQLPANVVSVGGPCHRLGELAQAPDGTALFCTEDPGGAGPLWLPASAGGGASGGGAGAPGGGVSGGGVSGGGAAAPGAGAPRPGGPCMQEGVSVPASDGTMLTCRLTGGGDVPGGLYWQVAG